MPSRKTAVSLVCLELALLLPGLLLLAHTADDERPTEPSGSLFLQWTHDYPPTRPAWPDQPALQFDAAYRPVIHGDLVLVSSPATDSVTALDAATGAEHWCFRCGGPVRFAPAVLGSRAWFSSDDGYLYCVDVHRGDLLWKIRGGPSGRKVLGNERLLSTWPARGAPVVVREGPGSSDLDPDHGEATVYFAAGIWPFMGVFLHALDAHTGKVRWTNDGDGSLYIKQPHQTDAYAGIAPQGRLVVRGDRLLVPSGRSVPACYDRKTGKLLHFKLADNSKRGGGADVQANNQVFLSGEGLFDLASGNWLGRVPQPAVLGGERIYAAVNGTCQIYEAQRGSSRIALPPDRGETSIRLPLPTRTPIGVMPLLLPGDGRAAVGAMAVAGDRLYVAAPGEVAALSLSTQRPKRVWHRSIEGTPAHLDSVGERLVVSTREGRISCFGPQAVVPQRHVRKPAPAVRINDVWGRKAEAILNDTGVRDGYCVAWGAGSGRLVTELAVRSNLRIIVVEPDPDRAAGLRGHLEAMDLYGDRVSLVVASPREAQLPPYLASVMVAEDLVGIVASPSAPGAEPDPDTGEAPEAFLRLAFTTLRPYGGVAVLPMPAPDLAAWHADRDLAQARWRVAGTDFRLAREGPLPGAADWTHEHADAANTRVSRDDRVKAPLGLLWFGGPGHDGVLPRHGHGPEPQVQAGRIFIEGVDMLRAVDLYTGRLLWQTPLPGVGRAFDNTAHQAGANANGSNYVCAADSIYVAHGKDCRRLDPATGRETAAFRLPPLPGEREPPDWTFISVCGDYLIGGACPRTSTSAGKKPPANPSSRHLFVLDRNKGNVLWRREAKSAFRHNAICAAGTRLFAIDRPGALLPWLKRRKDEPAPELLAMDLRTGRVAWRSNTSIFGTWLSYSAEHDVLVESGRNARDTLGDEPKGMRAYQGVNGHVLWYQKEFVGPAMIRGRMILRDRGGCDLLTGAVERHPDPLTGELVEWTWTRNYGCATPLASTHLLTFRSGAAGYYDLDCDGGTGNLGGFRAGCTNNLIVAGGVLSAADYTRTCTCSYQNQTSLALVPTADAEMWTFLGPRKVTGTIRQVGINLGAPGARQVADGTLWLEYPPTGGPSPRLEVKIQPEHPRWFRHHASSVSGVGLPWVMASGGCGLRDLRIRLAPVDGFERRYTVRLSFLEPDGLPAGRRRFDVALQGRTVLHGLDVSSEAGGPGRGLLKEFRGVEIGQDLKITLRPDPSAAVAETVLCGVEVLAEGW
jgi:outer membrane protein assembly factor BamB